MSLFAPMFTPALPPPPPPPLPIPVPSGIMSTVANDIINGVNSAVDGIQAAATNAAMGTMQVILQGSQGEPVTAQLGGDVVSRREFQAVTQAIQRAIRDNGQRDLTMAHRVEALERSGSAYAQPSYVQPSYAGPMFGGGMFAQGAGNPMGALAMASLVGGGGLSFTAAQKRALFLLTGDKSWLFLT